MASASSHHRTAVRTLSLAYLNEAKHMQPAMRRDGSVQSGAITCWPRTTARRITRHRAAYGETITRLPRRGIAAVTRLPPPPRGWRREIHAYLARGGYLCGCNKSTSRLRRSFCSQPRRDTASLRRPTRLAKPKLAHSTCRATSLQARVTRTRTAHLRRVQNIFITARHTRCVRGTVRVASHRRCVNARGYGTRNSTHTLLKSITARGGSPWRKLRD